MAKVSIGELIDTGVITAHKDGNYGSLYPRTSEFGEEGVPFLTAKIVSDDGKIDFKQASRLNYQKANQFSFGWIEKDDVLLSHNATVGRVALVPEIQEKMLVGTSLTYFRLDKERLLPTYLAAYMASKEFQDQLASVMSYSTRNQVPITIQRDLFIDAPCLSEQKFIGDAFESFYGKIELNRKTNETLEGIAKALFKSWFVDFDPVRAKAEGRPTGLPDEISELFPDSFEESELGEIPSGWTIEDLGSLAKISGGKQLGEGKLKEKGSVPVYGANGVMGFHEEKTHIGFVIIFGRVGAYCGSVKWEYDGAWVNNNASSVVPNSNSEFVLRSMLEADYTNLRSGSAQPFISNSALSASRVLSPPAPLKDLYCQLSQPLLLRQKAKSTQSETLALLRDALLPKLISGELRVPDAKKMLEEAGV